MTFDVGSLPIRLIFNSTAMEAVPANETTPSLSKSFNECIRLFRTFLLALHDENCRVVRLKQVDLTEISDQCGRAKIWGDQMRADVSSAEGGPAAKPAASNSSWSF